MKTFYTKNLFFLSLVSMTSSCNSMRNLPKSLQEVSISLTSLKNQLTSLTTSLASLNTSLSLIGKIYPEDSGTFVPRGQFFEDVVGMTEAEFRNLKENRDSIFVDKNPGNGIYKIKNKKTNRIYQCGSFEEISIQQLRNQTQHIDAIDLSTLAPDKKGKINIIEGFRDSNKKKEWQFWKVDIASNQANPEFYDAVFQVASNFNGLETISPSQNIDIQNITDYTGDKTQGPYAAISAAPGTILRHYFAFYDKNRAKGFDYWRQRADHNDQINFLSEISKPKGPLIMSEAGYVATSNAPAPTKTNDEYDDLPNLKIGFQNKVQVTHGLLNLPQENHILLNSSQYQIINQVFTAAANLADEKNNPNTPKAHEWCKLIQCAAYEGTLRAAAAKNKKKVFLTLIGGGVFINPKEWIVEAIERMKDFIIKSGLDVTVIIFGKNEINGTTRDRLKKLQQETGGQYIS